MWNKFEYSDWQYCMQMLPHTYANKDGEVRSKMFSLMGQWLTLGNKRILCQAWHGLIKWMLMKLGPPTPPITLFITCSVRRPNGFQNHSYTIWKQSIRALPSPPLPSPPLPPSPLPSPLLPSSSLTSPSLPFPPLPFPSSPHHLPFRPLPSPSLLLPNGQKCTSNVTG